MVVPLLQLSSAISWHHPPVPGQGRGSPRRAQSLFRAHLAKMPCRFIQMPRPGADNGVVFLLRGSADSAMEVTDERIFPMGKHRRILHDLTPARTVPIQGLAGSLRADPPIRAARGILILTLAAGSLGAGAAASAALISADHASSHQPAATS